MELTGDELVVTRICGVMRGLDSIHDDRYRVRQSGNGYDWT